jgi:hypothetical protein
VSRTNGIVPVLVVPGNSHRSRDDTLDMVCDSLPFCVGGWIISEYPSVGRTSGAENKQPSQERNYRHHSDRYSKSFFECHA